MLKQKKNQSSSLCLTKTHHISRESLRYCDREERESYFENINWIAKLSEKHDSDPDLELRKMILKKCVGEMAQAICDQYPDISVFEGVFGGRPHIKGHRFAVADVLSAICVYNNIEDVIDAYDNAYTEEQLKNAVRYARDFLEFSFSIR